MGSSTEMKVKIGIIAPDSHTVRALANLASEPDLPAVKPLRYQLPQDPGVLGNLQVQQNH